MKSLPVIVCFGVEQLTNSETESFKKLLDSPADIKYCAGYPAAADLSSMVIPQLVLFSSKLPITFSSISTLRHYWRYAVFAVISQNLDETLPFFLAAGVDDYIDLPLSVRDQEKLKLRLAAYRLRSVESYRGMGPLTISYSQRIVSNGSKSETLTPIETQIITVLLDHSGKVVERDLMKRLCWGETEVSDNALNRKIYEVRSRLRKLSKDVNIRTIYGHGFELKF